MDRRPSGLSETERNLLSSRNFLIVAFVLFVVIKFVNSLHRKPAEPEAPAEPTTKVCPYCQSEISIKAVRCPHCTSKLEGFPEINN